MCIYICSIYKIYICNMCACVYMYIHLTGFVFLENPNTTPKIPSCVWRVLYLISLGT